MNNKPFTVPASKCDAQRCQFRVTFKASTAQLEVKWKTTKGQVKKYRGLGGETLVKSKMKVVKQGRSLRVKVTPAYGRKVLVRKATGYSPKDLKVKASKKRSGWVTIKNLAPGEYWVEAPATARAEGASSFGKAGRTIKIG
jgi:hypothetical protein